MSKNSFRLLVLLATMFVALLLFVSSSTAHGDDAGCLLP